MFRRVFVLAAMVSLMAAVLPATAAAEGFITPFVGSVFKGDLPKNKVTFGGAVGGMWNGTIGGEVEVGYTPTLLDDEGSGEANLLTFTVNLLAGVPIGGFRPYAAVGLGLIRQRTSISFAGLFSDVTDNDFGVNVGGGFRAMFTENIGIRGDIRFFHVRKTGGLNFGRGYGGLVFGF